MMSFQDFLLFSVYAPFFLIWIIPFFIFKEKIDSTIKSRKTIQKGIFYLLIFLAAGFIFFSFFVPFLFEEKRNIENMSPFIAISAAILTFLAFWTQYQANQEMLRENKKQQIITRFYETLSIHRDNVRELEWDQKVYEKESIYTTNRIKKKNGREIFQFFLIEFNVIYKIIDVLYGNISIKEKIKTAYNIFYKGIDDNRFTFDIRNDILAKISSSNRDIFFNTSSFLMHDNAQNITIDKTKLLQAASELFNHKDFFLSNRPFYGHFEELNNYYRHLFLTVKNIAKEDEKYLSYLEKRDLLRILRAQLTNTEQIMLFYNWFSENGKQWEAASEKGNHFFTQYRMIHNITPHKIIPFQKRPNDYNKSYERFMNYFAQCLSIQEYGSENDPIFEFEDWKDHPKFNYTK